MSRSVSGAGETSSPSQGLRLSYLEHAARIAGVITIFENPDAAEVSATTLVRAIALSEYYAQTALRLHGGSQVNAKLVAAESLLEWLQNEMGT